MLQFGGQTAINLALPLEARRSLLAASGADVGILGTSCDAIDEASDRERFEAFAKRAGLRMPRGATGTTPDDVRRAVESIGFPVLIRPSYVLGGRGMEIVYDEAGLRAERAEARARRCARVRWLLLY